MDHQIGDSVHKKDTQMVNGVSTCNKMVEELDDLIDEVSYSGECHQTDKLSEVNDLAAFLSKQLDIENNLAVKEVRKSNARRLFYVCDLEPKQVTGCNTDSCNENGTLQISGETLKVGIHNNTTLKNKDTKFLKEMMYANNWNKPELDLAHNPELNLAHIPELDLKQSDQRTVLNQKKKVIPWVNSDLWCYQNNNSISSCQKDNLLPSIFEQTVQSSGNACIQEDKSECFLNKAMTKRNETNRSLVECLKTETSQAIVNTKLKDLVDGKHAKWGESTSVTASSQPEKLCFNSLDHPEVPYMLKYETDSKRTLPSKDLALEDFLWEKMTGSFDCLLPQKCFLVDLFIEDKDTHLGPLPFEIYPKMNVRLLKLKVEKEFGIISSVQRWIFGKTLAVDNDMALIKYGVLPGSPLFLYVDSCSENIVKTKSKSLVQSNTSSLNTNKNYEVNIPQIRYQKAKHSDILKDMCTEIVDKGQKKNNIKSMFSNFQTDSLCTQPEAIEQDETCELEKTLTLRSHSLFSNLNTHQVSKQSEKSSQKLCSVLTNAKFIKPDEAAVDKSRCSTSVIPSSQSAINRNSESQNGIPKSNCTFDCRNWPLLNGKSRDKLSLDNSLPIRCFTSKGHTRASNNGTKLVDFNNACLLNVNGKEGKETLLVSSENYNNLLNSSAMKSIVQSNSFINGNISSSFQSVSTKPSVKSKSAENSILKRLSLSNRMKFNEPVSECITEKATFCNGNETFKEAIHTNTNEHPNKSVHDDIEDANITESSNQVLRNEVVSEVVYGDTKDTYVIESSNQVLRKEVANEVLEVQYQEPCPESSRNYELLLKTESLDLVHNVSPFTCPICLVEFEYGQGVVLHECLHTFCLFCLARTIDYSETALIKCPYRNETYSCESFLQQREIKALVPADVYEKYLQRSVTTAESLAEKSFHCKTADCPGWCMFEDNINIFHCPVCLHYNCLSCSAIHEGLNCRQYQDKLKSQEKVDHDSEKTLEFLNKMIYEGKAMKCPKCDLILMKKWGCDWFKCSICHTEICWITKGPRWGPGGHGDTSAGCRCGVNGMKCHTSCTYCH